MRPLPKLATHIGFAFKQANNLRVGSTIFGQSLITRRTISTSTKPEITLLEPVKIKKETHEFFTDKIFTSQELQHALKDDYSQQMGSTLSEFIVDEMRDSLEEYLEKNDKEFFRLVQQFARKEIEWLYFEQPVGPEFTDLPHLPISGNIPPQLRQKLYAENFVPLSFLMTVMNIGGFLLKPEYPYVTKIFSTNHKTDDIASEIHVDGITLFENMPDATSLYGLRSDNKTGTYFLDSKRIAKDIGEEHLKVLSNKFDFFEGSVKRGSAALYDKEKGFIFNAKLGLNNLRPQVDCNYKEAIRAMLLAFNNHAYKVILKDGQAIVQQRALHGKDCEKPINPLVNQELDVPPPPYLKAEEREDSGRRIIVGDVYKKITPRKIVSPHDNSSLTTNSPTIKTS